MPVAIVDHGKVIALGSTRDLIASLGGEHVGDITLISGKSTNGAWSNGHGVMLEGASLASQGANIAILLVWGAVTFGVGLKLFRWN